MTFHLANELGIHGATPSEKLHATLLGMFKCVRDIFFKMIGPTSQLAEDINGLATIYGKALKHQSDRRFPCVSFAKGIAKGKLMATQCRGVLLVMACVLRSSGGHKMLMARKRFGGENGLRDWITLVELLLEWETFLCKTKMKRSLVKKLDRKHRFIMCMILNVAKRTEGMGFKAHEIPCHSSHGEGHAFVWCA